MNIPSPTEGRASLSRSYRNLSERDIRAKLDAPLSDAERVTAKAELLRRGAGDEAGDTALATGFEPTSALGLDVAGGDGAASQEVHAPAPGRRRLWLAVGGTLLGVVLVAAWAMRSKLAHIASAWGG
jgi:hypothetical protein